MYTNFNVQFFSQTDSSFLRSERSKLSLLGNFCVYSNSGFVLSLGLLEFFVCVLLSRCASEASGAYSETFGFVRILGFFEVRVCLYILDSVFFCFCGVSEASGAHSEILGNFFCYICNVRY